MGNIAPEDQEARELIEYLCRTFRCDREQLLQQSTKLVASIALLTEQEQNLLDRLKEEEAD